MIAKHPTKSGWLKGTHEVIRLLEAEWLIVINGESVSPLAPFESDFLDSDVEPARQYALSCLNTWRGNRRAAFGLIEAMYYEALRWQSDKSSQLGLNPGRLTNEAYTTKVINTWDKIEADYSLGVSLVNQAGDVDTIAIILSRRV